MPKVPTMYDANYLAHALRAGSVDHENAPFAVGEGLDLDYRTLWQRAERNAGALVATGVVSGDRVAVQVEKSLAAVELYLGCVLAGATFLPLNTAYTPAEVGYFLTDAEPQLVICDPAQAAALQPLAAGVHVLTLDAKGSGSLTETVFIAAPLTEPVPRGPNDLAAILYTSGTTGRSKGAMLTHANLRSNAEVLVQAWRFTRDDCLLHALPIFHTHGLFVAINTVLSAGASMIFHPKFDAEAILSDLPRATVLMGVPTFYTRLLDLPGLRRGVVSGVRLFVSGSAPLLADTHREWTARTGHAILERYGMTETNMNTSNPYSDERRPGTVGFPLSGVELRIADANGNPVPQGEIGGIEVRGPNVFKGYWRMPEKTAAELRRDGFFITGDLGVIDADGYVSIVGRSKDLIISGGLNIYPKEIESVVDTIQGVIESAAFGLPHPDFGESVALAIVAAKGAALTVADIEAAITPQLARFKHPRHIRFVEALPRNTMGKVQKALLRTRFTEETGGLSPRK